MNYTSLHPWKVSARQAVSIQQKLRNRLIIGNRMPEIRKIAGVDVAFSDKQAFCAVCVFDYPDLNLIETKTAKSKINFPYVPGLLTFREGPVILEALRKIKHKPDLVLFDGQGICHPRRMGIAAHMGLFLNIPSIGCAKSHLYGAFKMPGKNKGAFSFIHEIKTNEVLGIALRTRKNIKPIFVSCGYKSSLMQVKYLILSLCPKYRIPQPLRYAHQKAEYAKLSI